MNKRKCLSIILAVLMITHLTSSPVLAIKISADSIERFSVTEKDFLISSGLELDEITRLEEINHAIKYATSAEEIHRLIEESHSIIDNSLLASSTSFYSYFGGTLYLEYTGSLSLNNSLYTKIVYLGPTQTEAFYEMYTAKTSIGQLLLNSAIKKGIKTITKTLADDIAAIIGLSSSAVSFLIGQSVNVIYNFITSLDEDDFMDAYDRSTMGKVKLEFFTVTSISAPYYLEVLNFEPWNSGSVEVPANYDYTWSSQVYDHNYDVE